MAAPGDVPGSADVAGLKRYEGSTIIGYKSEAYGELTHPAAKAEGKYTRLLYRAPTGRSSLEVERNYRRDLTASGGKVLWECSGGECESSNTEVQADGRWLAKGILYTCANAMQLNNSTIYAFSTPREARYLLMKVPASGGAGKRLVSIYAAREDSDTKRIITMF